MMTNWLGSRCPFLFAFSHTSNFPSNFHPFHRHPTSTTDTTYTHDSRRLPAPRQPTENIKEKEKEDTVYEIITIGCCTELNERYDYAAEKRDRFRKQPYYICKVCPGFLLAVAQEFGFQHCSSVLFFERYSISTVFLRSEERKSFF